MNRTKMPSVYLKPMTTRKQSQKDISQERNHVSHVKSYYVFRETLKYLDQRLHLLWKLCGDICLIRVNNRKT